MLVTLPSIPSSNLSSHSSFHLILLFVFLILTNINSRNSDVKRTILGPCIFLFYLHGLLAFNCIWHTYIFQYLIKVNQEDDAECWASMLTLKIENWTWCPAGCQVSLGEGRKLVLWTPARHLFSTGTCRDNMVCSKLQLFLSFDCFTHHKQMLAFQSSTCMWNQCNLSQTGWPLLCNEGWLSNLLGINLWFICQYLFSY